MYRVFSLFISYRHLYITNILHSCVYSYLLPLCDYCYCFRIEIFDIYLSAPLMYLLFCYLTFRFRMAISHRVDVLTQDRCVGFPHSNLLYHTFSDTPVLDQSLYTDGRSSTALFFVLVDDISIEMDLARVSIEVGRYSWYQSHIRNKCRILTMNL